MGEKTEEVLESPRKEMARLKIEQILRSFHSLKDDRQKESVILNEVKNLEAKGPLPKGIGIIGKNRKTVFA